MGTVVQMPTVRSLEQRIEILAALVAQLMAVLKARELLDTDDLTEVTHGAQLALQWYGPLLGQPTDHIARAAGAYADSYEFEGIRDCVLTGSARMLAELEARRDAEQV